MSCYVLLSSKSYFRPSPLNFARNVFVSLATIPDRRMSATRLGNAMSPLKISALVQTALTVRYGPMKMAKM